MNTDQRIFFKAGLLILLSLAALSLAEGAVVLMAAGLMAMAGGFIAYRLWNIESRIQSSGAAYGEAQARYLHALAAEKETDARFRTVTAGTGILSYLDGKIQYHHSRNPPPQTGPGQAHPIRPNPAAGERMRPALSVIRNSLCLVLLGSQGTGKTTLLCHLIDHRDPDGETLIIDPHGYPEKYGNRDIIGAGRDYDSINDCMTEVLDEINRRYQDYHENDYPLLWVYVDEATLLKKNCDAFQSFMEIMLTESRKVNVRLTLCLHSRRAKFLGLAGAMDLAEGIDWLNLKNENGRRWGELETDNGVIPLALPGPYPGDIMSCRHTENTTCHPHDTGFYDHNTVTDEPPCLNYDPDAGEYCQWEEPEPRFYESKTDKAICEMYLNGASLNQIIKDCLHKTPNGRYAGQVKAVLKQYGILFRVP